MSYLLRSGFVRSDADDLLQETFSRVFRSLATFDSGRGKLVGWVATIAKNVARRQWKRRTTPENFDPQLAEEMFASEEDPSHTPETREAMQSLDDCIAAVPDELARFVKMRYVDGLTTRGIATIVEMPEATVRLRLAEAIRKIEQCMKTKGFFNDQ